MCDFECGVWRFLLGGSGLRLVSVFRGPGCEFESRSGPQQSFRVYGEILDPEP